MSLAAEVAGARSPRACLSRPTSPVHLLPHPLRFLLAWRLDIARLSSNWKEFGAIIPPAPCARDPLESWEIDNTHRWKISCGGRRPAQRRTSGTQPPAAEGVGRGRRRRSSGAAAGKAPLLFVDVGSAAEEIGRTRTASARDPLTYRQDGETRHTTVLEKPLRLGARAAPVVSRDNASPVSKPTRVFLQKLQRRDGWKKPVVHALN